MATIRFVLNDPDVVHCTPVDADLHGRSDNFGVIIKKARFPIDFYVEQYTEPVLWSSIPDGPVQAITIMLMKGKFLNSEAEYYASWEGAKTISAQIKVATLKHPLTCISGELVPPEVLESRALIEGFTALTPRGYTEFGVVMGLVCQERFEEATRILNAMGMAHPNIFFQSAGAPLESSALHTGGLLRPAQRSNYDLQSCGDLLLEGLCDHIVQGATVRLTLRSASVLANRGGV